jgi:phospholipase D1/2
MEPQNCDLGTQPVTNFMRPAPNPVEDESHSEDDQAVADPLSSKTISLWDNTARKNREIFTELFRPVPTNLVRTRAAYKVGSNLEFQSALLTAGYALGVPTQSQ